MITFNLSIYFCCLHRDEDNTPAGSEDYLSVFSYCHWDEDNTLFTKRNLLDQTLSILYCILYHYFVIFGTTYNKDSFTNSYDYYMILGKEM